jgi:hypothetical protein
MKRCVLILVIVTALAATSSATSATAIGPTLRVADTSPVLLHGSGFKRHEVVRLVFRAQTTSSRRVVANAAGRFTVRLPFAVQPCVTYSLIATGILGSKTSLKLPPAMCPNPASDPDS